MVSTTHLINLILFGIHKIVLWLVLSRPLALSIHNFLHKGSRPYPNMIYNTDDIIMSGYSLLCPLYPSCLQTTLASNLSQRSSHTVPYIPLTHISTVPSPLTELPTRRTLPFTHTARDAGIKKKDVHIDKQSECHLCVLFGSLNKCTSYQNSWCCQ